VSVVKQFLGAYPHKLDAKSKLSLPKAFRDMLPEQVILTKGLDKNILVMSPEVWSTFLEIMQEQPSPDLQDFFMRNQFEMEIDKVGRILIPAELRSYAEIENREVSVCGVGNMIEIWERQRKEAKDNEVRQAEESRAAMRAIMMKMKTGAPQSAGEDS
jgi:MraZ protein